MNKICYFNYIFISGLAVDLGPLVDIDCTLIGEVGGDLKSLVFSQDKSVNILLSKKVIF